MSKTERRKLRDKFVAWQCRLRQIAMREDGGRPSPGMRPRLLDGTGAELTPRITVIIVPKAPEESTAFFRFQVMKSSDPREIYEKALRYLQAEYFQSPDDFGDQLVATLPGDAPAAAQLLALGRCVLEFAEGNVIYRLACKVQEIEETDPVRAAAIWHNRIFNPSLPDTVRVLGFVPRWKDAEIVYPDPGALTQRLSTSKRSYRR